MANKTAGLALAFLMAIGGGSMAMATEAPKQSQALQMETNKCNGAMYSGEYIAAFHPSFAPITKDDLNAALGRDAVADLRPLSGNTFLIQPAISGEDCNAFMKAVQGTGLVRYVEPNYIVGINPPRLK